MKWRKRQKRITRKRRSNDEYCLESRSKKDRTCETNRNFLPRQKRHRKRMDSKRQTLKASLLFLYYPEGNTFVDLSLPLSAKLVIATWFLFFFFLNQRLESSVTIFLRNIGHGEGNWITNKRKKNQRTTDSMLRKYTKESVYRNIILFVRPEGRSCRKKIWLPKPRRLGVVPVYCGAARKLSRQFAKTRGEIRNSRAYTSNPIG